MAERLLALADRHTRSVTHEQQWTLTLTTAQAHATLALAAATRLSARKPEIPSESIPGPDPLLRRPPLVFPPEDRPRHWAGAGK